LEDEMENRAEVETPFRIGVYARVHDADRAVQRLLEEGFTKDQISVVCSDEHKERHFKQFEHMQPAGASTPAAAAVGGTIGAALGGLTALAAGAMTGGVALVVAGGAAAWTGGVLGGFLGAMMTRGTEKEPADYYQQAVQRGKLLVAVEVEESEDQAALARAERIFTETGAEPLPLTEG
jgi:hypothetical protein